MNQQDIINLAAEYLEKDGVAFVKPGTIRKLEPNSNAYLSPGDIVKADENTYEVNFLKPEALDPHIVIDPPDIRVLVNTKTKVVSWIYQM